MKKWVEPLVCSDPGALSVMLRDWISSEVQGERRPVIPGVEEDCVCVCVCVRARAHTQAGRSRAGPTAPPWGLRYRYKGVWGQRRGSWDIPHWPPCSSRQPRAFEAAICFTTRKTWEPDGISLCPEIKVPSCAFTNWFGTFHVFVLWMSSINAILVWC